MRWVIKYHQCEQACPDLASQLSDSKDKHALELMADGWAKRVAECRCKLAKEARERLQIGAHAVTDTGRSAPFVIRKPILRAPRESRDPNPIEI
jgi:hypothetical protein